MSSDKPAVWGTSWSILTNTNLEVILNLLLVISVWIHVVMCSRNFVNFLKIGHIMVFVIIPSIILKNVACHRNNHIALSREL